MEAKLPTTPSYRIINHNFMQAGMFLKSTAFLKGSIFENTLVFIAEFNQNGAMGFIVNKRFLRNLNDLAAFSNSIPVPLYDGGPVDREHLFFLHQRPDIIEGGTPITEKFFLGDDFRQAINSLKEGRISEEDLKLFIGYCGWDAGELEEEVKEGSWETTTPAHRKLFVF